MAALEVPELSKIDLSIIVPCHNLENYITPLLVSLELQVLSNYKVEIIFVCDACEDETAGKIRSFHFYNYERVEILECEVFSAGLARNVGKREAKGEYTWFVDGDDWLLYPFAIECIMERLIEEGRPNVLKIAYDCPEYFYAKGSPTMVWQYIYKTDFIKYTSFTGISPHEDSAFNQRVGELNGGLEKLPFIGKPLYYYNFLRKGSTMQQFFTKGRIDP